jgi:hypothetical protein
MVHDYITKLLARICPDKQVRDRIWTTLLADKLRKAYNRAMDEAYSLLLIERDGRPSTYNHYFNSEVQKKRQQRLCDGFEEHVRTYYKANHNKLGTEQQAVPIAIIRNLVFNKDNAQQIREDILDVLASYYKVSRKRFVDNTCRQVIGHFLLDSEDSPLKIFSPELVMGLDAEQLESIAGEDADTKDRRAMLEVEINSLETAMEVLRV